MPVDLYEVRALWDEIEEWEIVKSRCQHSLNDDV